MRAEESLARKGKLKADDAESVGENESVVGGEKRPADDDSVTDDKR